jgi:hypothetical protein
MDDAKHDDTPRVPFALRRNVLLMLYGFFKEFPYASVEFSRIAADCDTDAKELNWNMVYLEKAGYLALSRSTESYPFVACAASLTARGIDLIENPVALNRLFPPEGASKG